MSRRIILDTSTLVSAALRIGSIPFQVLQQALGGWDICASSDTLAELEAVLERRKFDRYLDRVSRRAFIDLMHRNVHLFSIQEKHRLAVDPHCRDAEDDKFLALAITAEVSIIVSSDEDLLILDPWRGTPIIKPKQFLTQFKPQ